jgi:glycine betaine/proline transport system ATP-binding protein
MREHQLDELFVVGRDRSLQGVVLEGDIAAAVRAGKDTLDGIVRTDFPSVTPDVTVADLFLDAAEKEIPLPVVSDSGRLLGVIATVTLLNALAANSNGHDAVPPDAGRHADPDDGQEAYVASASPATVSDGVAAPGEPAVGERTVGA